MPSTELGLEEAPRRASVDCPLEDLHFGSSVIQASADSVLMTPVMMKMTLQPERPLC